MIKESLDTDTGDADQSKTTTVLQRLVSMLHEYRLSDMQKMAAGKFIKDCIADKENRKVDRLREWILKKINGSRVKPANNG